MSGHAGHHGWLLAALAAAAASFASSAGCQPRRPAEAVTFDELPASAKSGLSEPVAIPEVEAVCAPPAGWLAEPLEQTDRHAQQLWLSPTGKTAFGVIRFKLPLPVGPDWALHWGFLPEMRRSEGRAELLSQEDDPALGGIRFVAEGGRYTVRTNLVTQGWRGWAVYAGTLTGETVEADELELAERAREGTRLGLPDPPDVEQSDPQPPEPSDAASTVSLMDGSHR